jgi:hypothetical protein
MTLQLIALNKQDLLKFYRDNKDLYRASYRLDIIKRQENIYSFNNFDLEWLRERELNFRYIENKWIIVPKYRLLALNFSCPEFEKLQIDSDYLEGLIDDYCANTQFRIVIRDLAITHRNKINTMGKFLNLYRKWYAHNPIKLADYVITLNKTGTDFKFKDLTLAVKEQVAKPFKEFLNECVFGYEQETWNTEDEDVPRSIQNIKNIKVHTDGSVDGYEFVTSKPLPFGEITAFAKDVITECNKNSFEINEKCSGHISISHPQIKHQYDEEVQAGLSIFSILPLYTLISSRFLNYSNYEEYYRFRISTSKYTAVNHHSNSSKEYWEYRFIGGKIELDKINEIFETVAYSLYITYKLRYEEPDKLTKIIQDLEPTLSETLNERVPSDKQKSIIESLFQKSLRLLQG